MSHPQNRPRGRPDTRTPAARPTTYPQPADIIRDLVTLLRGHGLTRLYWSACTHVGVLSITQGLTVWCDGQYLCWRRDDTPSTWPAADTHGAANHLAKLALNP